MVSKIQKAIEASYIELFVDQKSAQIPSSRISYKKQHRFKPQMNVEATKYTVYHKQTKKASMYEHAETHRMILNFAECR